MPIILTVSRSVRPLSIRFLLFVRNGIDNVYKGINGTLWMSRNLHHIPPRHANGNYSNIRADPEILEAWDFYQDRTIHPLLRGPTMSEIQDFRKNMHIFPQIPIDCGEYFLFLLSAPYRHESDPVG